MFDLLVENGKWLAILLIAVVLSWTAYNIDHDNKQSQLAKTCISTGGQWLNQRAANSNHLSVMECRR